MVKNSKCSWFSLLISETVHATDQPEPKLFARTIKIIAPIKMKIKLTMKTIFLTFNDEIEKVKFSVKI
ncbi:hypothetical protein NUBL13939_50090 [Klebsiella pneumoniae]|nr:hypothetical protein NUBL13939_50090 [Klebsiella pneumoniae]